MLNCLAFDIETVPDVAFGRRLHGLGDLPDDDVAQLMLMRRRQQVGHEFLALPQHRIVAISVVLRQGGGLRVWSLGEADSDEAELVRRFFEGIERFSPDLVSWNGSGFDLPVLHYRALRHGISAPRYWESGERDASFRFNNYLNRFHSRHTDLMDVLAGYQASGRARLDEIAVLLGLPGKMGMSGADVYGAWRDGGIERIRDYCETDAVNTYLVYLHYQHMRGTLDDTDLDRETTLVRDTLGTLPGEHWLAFLEAWSPAEGGG